MSYVRILVANKLWCASRIVVSVKCIFFSAFSHFENSSGPNFVSRSFVPLGKLAVLSNLGTIGLLKDLVGSIFLTSEFPFTITSPRYVINFVALFLEILNLNKSGFALMKFTVTFPSLKVSCFKILSKNGMFVLTPLILNSAKALLTFLHAPSKVLLFAVTLTSIESKNGEIMAP